MTKFVAGEQPIGQGPKAATKRGIRQILILDIKKETPVTVHNGNFVLLA